ncbi:MAG: hypothetical protein JWQ98_1326 [Chlorobi bacterium]|nr:hypothetical protein [Chlorobiota bacterium]
MNSPGYSFAVVRRRWASLILLLLLLASGRLSAQGKYYPDQPLPDNLFLPLIHIHGLSDTTFFIGGEMATNTTSGDVRDMWKFAGDSLGLNVMEYRGDQSMQHVDSLAKDTGPNGTIGVRRLMCWIDKYSGESGWGRQVTFYPFDYAESYYWKCKFLTRSDGTLDSNLEVKDDHKNRAPEQVYDSTNTTRGATVAQQIAFGYDPMQVNRYPGHDGGNYPLTQNVETILSGSHFNYGQTSWYIAVTAHLFDPNKLGSGGGGAADTDALLAIDIYNEIPNGSRYFDATMPVILYLTKAKTIDGTSIDSVIHCEVWNVADATKGPFTETDAIIKATARAAFIDSVTATYAPTPVIIRDSTFPDIDFHSFDNPPNDPLPPDQRLGALHARRDTALRYPLELEERNVRKDRQRRNDSSYNAHLHTSTSDQALLYHTIWVRKSDLPPVEILGRPNYNQYSTPVYQINLARERGSISGPANAALGSRRFDIRIRWMGKEKLALRSIAIRDTLGEMLLGNEPQSITYRQDLVNMAQTLYFGTPNPSPTTQPRENIPLAYFGDEPTFTEYAGFNAIDRLLRDSTAPGGDTTRSLRPHFEMNQVIPHKVLISNAAIVEPGFYQTSARDITAQFGLPDSYAQPPVLRMHDGGCWNVPALGETADSVELFETAYQRATICEYNPGASIFPFQYTKLTDLGMAAHAASRSGRWLIPWIGVHGDLSILWRHDPSGAIAPQPELQWIVEAAQLRLEGNLALCYGARGVHYPWVGSDTSEFQTDATPIDASHPTKFFCNWGPVGYFTDRTQDHIPLFTVMTDFDLSHRATIPNFYTGWGVRLREMQWLDKTWFPSVGKYMLKLRWCDGYSVHFTHPQSYLQKPYQSDHRPLPSTEIVTAVQSWKPSIDDEPIHIDPPEKTYVELGFFNTVKGADTSNRMLDTNYMFVVNRRVFERPDDTTASSAYGRKLDTLAETRTIALKLHLQHPDQSSYNFVRVTEIEPDSTPLPLIGRRKGLDTILFGDSTVALTIRPGGGALLRITYAPPGTSFPGGDLRYNNQRKMVFDGLRYHACYFRPITYYYPFSKTDPHWKQFAGNEDAVFYRRSLPMTDTTGGIRWEPIDYMVSDTTADSTVRENRFPSMSVRVQNDRLSPVPIGGDTVVTIVWTRYRGPGTRSVALRNVRSKGDGPVQLSNRQEVMGIYTGVNDGYSGEPAWGTPVVSRLDGGDMVAWSDSAQGICARLRMLGTGTTWWQSSAPNVGYTSVIVPSSPMFTWGWPSPPGVCMFPSMPASAHVRGLDSNIGIVWQDMQTGTGTSRIDYARLVHRVTGPQNWVGITNTRIINQGDLPINLHPSIDAAQDVWYDVQEAVTWDARRRLEPELWRWVHFPPIMIPLTKDQSIVGFSSLFTPTTRRTDPANSANTSYWNPFWDDIKPTRQWTYDWTIRKEMKETGGNRYFIDYYPNTSSLNARDPLHPNEKIHFSLVTSAVAPSAANNFYSTAMAQMFREYAVRNYLGFRTYLLGGFMPNGAASPTRQPLREAVIYRINDGSNLMQTSRQFFARLRPTGYTAQGRAVSIPVNDSMPAGFSMGMFDAWVADNSASHPLAMAAYPDSVHRIDSLPQVHALMRTEYFQAHDSTEISCTINSHRFGDSSLIDSARITFVIELVDSATNSVVRTFDSVELSDTTHDDYMPRDTVVDLLSGTYYLRMRIVPVNLPVLAAISDSRFPVAEVSGEIGDSIIGKFHRIEAVTGAAGRLSVHPNPTPGGTQIVFSVPEQERASVTIYDAMGRRITQPLDGVTEAGRYGIDLNAGALPPGTYLVEFRYGENRLVEKLVVVR